MTKRLGLPALIGALLLSPAAAAAPSFDERVAAQRAIEQVYWDRRSWPKENSGPKPAFDAVLTGATIRARVEDYLEKSNALEQLWGRRITAAMLQAELERMAERTRDPQTLAQIFAALGNDPSLIAETLARQTLADRLIRSSYSRETATTVWPKTPFDTWWRAVHGTFSVRLEEDPWVFTFVAPSGAAGCDPDTWSPTHESDVPESRSQHTVVWTGAEMIVWGGTDGGDDFFNTGSRYNPATDTWSRTSTALEPRGGHSAVWTGTEMIVWGGAYDFAVFDTGGRYDPTSDTWLPTSTANAPSERNGHSAVWTGTEMIVWGGSGLDTGGRYDPSSDTWEATPTTGAPHPRSWQTAVWTGSEMIVWGGYDFQLAVNTGSRYNPSTNRWAAVSTGANVPAPRGMHTAVWTGTEMIVWGGGDFSVDNPLNSGGRYDPSTDTWAATSIGAGVPDARVAHAAVWAGTQMIVWGGSDDSIPFDTGGRYDPSTDTWTPTSTGASVPSERFFHTAVWTGTEMIVWGGSHLASDGAAGGRYDPSSDTWTPTWTEPDMPSPRFEHTAVWTGAEMIVWGGSESFPLNTGSRYVPATDSWTRTPDVNAPQARFNHTAAWTGTEMIVWGGHAFFGDLNTGGRYDPATDSWTPTSTGDDLPAPRTSHTAVWTGAEMIVWGGFWGGSGGGVFHDTGGRYDPATDSWTPTSTGANDPAPRFDHTALWTGAEMVVWGGLSSTGNLSTGGRYDPATDNWTPTSSGAEVPAPRRLHTAVWTGTEMIVWGGSLNSSVSLSTGGRYDPVVDSWTPTSTGAGVPSARRLHTAVWTGTEMIVWGGRDLSSLNTGGRYDLTANAWTPTSSGANVPSPRYEHTAVWTGTEMIVWGGYQPSATGGRYCVCASAYLDADLDGYGDPAVSAPACDGSLPAGHVTNHADCNDANDAVNPGSTEVCNGLDDDCDGWVEDDFDLDGVAACLGDCDEDNGNIYPGAPEINDGLDNQCPGEAGYEVVDEIASGFSFDESGSLSWPAQPQATLYQYARATTPQFAGDCLTGFVSDPSWYDPDTPPADAAFHYLVRAFTPWLGSWGRSSDDTERTVDCVEESCDDGLDNDGDGLVDCLDADCESPPVSYSPVSQSAAPATGSLFASAANVWDGNPATYAFCSYAWPTLPAGSCGGQFKFGAGHPASGHIEISVSHVFQTCGGSATEASYSLDGGATWVPFVDVPGSSSIQTYSSPTLNRVSLGSLRVRVVGQANCIPPGGNGTTGTIRLYELRFVDEGGCDLDEASHRPLGAANAAASCRGVRALRPRSGGRPWQLVGEVRAGQGARREGRGLRSRR